MIVDCFTFFDEFDVLEIRLGELSPVVDLFILAEARQTFQGRDKPLYFRENAGRFKSYLRKIEHLVVDLPETNDPWIREASQRNGLKLAISNLPQDARVLISDVDEVFRPSALKEVAGRDEFGFVEMDLYYYFLNLRSRGTKWVKAYFDQASEIMKIEDLSRPRWRELEYLKDRGFASDSLVKNGGWHFTWLASRILHKIDSFSHTEMRPWLKRKREIAREVSEGQKFFVTGEILEEVPLESLPLSVQSDHKHLAEAGYFWKPEPWYRRIFRTR